MQSFNLGQIPPVAFGAGRLLDAPGLVAAHGGGPVLVVADTVLAELGVVERLAEALGKAGIACEIAAVVVGEPKETLIDDLCDRARRAEARCVIGLGGGASLDAAKLVAAIARSGQKSRDFALAAQPLPEAGMPAIAIPTTAGTGSEVTRISIVSTPDGRKNWYSGPGMMFAQAILDPELTLSLPPHITAWTGIDAMAHALEATTVRNTTPVGQLFGLEALRILSDALPRAVADGADIEIRGRVLWGSMVAGVALNNCNVHMGHNISHALGSLARVHHGHATGLGLHVSLPWLVARAEGAENYARAAQALGAAPRPEALPDAFSKLMQACAIAPELPRQCTGISHSDLSAEMKSNANIMMARNAACDIADAELDEIASRVLSLPIASAAA